MRGSHIDRTIFGNIGIITPSTEGGYVGHIPEVPGCITQGETVKECRAMLKDALRGWVEVATEHRRDALDGQAALDEANNRITELEQDLVAQDVLIKEAKQSAERLEAELAAEKSRVAALAELIEEQGIISEKILRLAEATDKDSLGLKKFIEITSLETKDWLNGLGIVHDCGWREAISNRLQRMEKARQRCGLCKDYSHSKVKCYHDHEGYRPPQATCGHPAAGFRLVDWAVLEDK